MGHAYTLSRDIRRACGLRGEMRLTHRCASAMSPTKLEKKNKNTAVDSSAGLRATAAATSSGACRSRGSGLPEYVQAVVFILF